MKAFLCCSLLCLACSSSSFAFQTAFVSSPDEGIIYKVDLSRGTVEKVYRIGGYPQYINLGDDYLFIEGEAGQNGWAYIDVFSILQEKIVKRITTGVVSAGPVHFGRELIYAIQRPRPEILFLDTIELRTSVLPMPDELVPISMALSSDRQHLWIVASEYQEVGVPRRTVLIDLHTKYRKHQIKKELPKYTDAIVIFEDRVLIHVGRSGSEDRFILLEYPNLKTLKELQIPYFCEEYTNRQKYIVTMKLRQFVIGGGDCAGDEKLEKNEPTILSLNLFGDLVWKVTSSADGIPSPFSLATLADGRIVFVSSDFGAGVLDPRTGKLMQQIKFGNSQAIWGLAVPDLELQER